MNLVTITPPVAAVTAAEAKAAGVFAAADGDTLVDLLLAAAQGTIDGPAGWLGRAIGVQTIEMQIAGIPSRLLRDVPLPFPTATSIVSATTVGADGIETVLDPSSYYLAGGAFLPKSNWPSPYNQSSSIRIRYTAGVATADVPVPIKHAIMLMARQLRDVAPVEGALKRRDVEGIGSREWFTPDLAAGLVRSTVEALLQGYRVLRV